MQAVMSRDWRHCNKEKKTFPTETRVSTFANLGVKQGYLISPPFTVPVNKKRELFDIR